MAYSGEDSDHVISGPQRINVAPNQTLSQRKLLIGTAPVNPPVTTSYNAGTLFVTATTNLPPEVLTLAACGLAVPLIADNLVFIFFTNHKAEYALSMRETCIGINDIPQPHRKFSF